MAGLAHRMESIRRDILSSPEATVQDAAIVETATVLVEAVEELTTSLNFLQTQLAEMRIELLNK